MSTFKYDSIFGGLNLLKRFDNRFLETNGQRTPYPIINESPSIQDVLLNMNRADFAFVLLSAAIGNFLCFLWSQPFVVLSLSTALPLSKRSLFANYFKFEYTRRSSFKILYSLVLGWGFAFGYMNSLYRLQGQIENGLIWKRPSNTLRKYDLTSDFEKATIWRHFRLHRQ